MSVKAVTIITLRRTVQRGSLECIRILREVWANASFGVVHVSAPVGTIALEEILMTHVICEPCVGTKDKACVGACPVDCIYEADGCSGELGKGDEMLYINPDECIDCGACVDPCPVSAIFAEDDVPAEWKDYVEINAKAFA